jgi:hypothetical protein
LFDVPLVARLRRRRFSFKSAKSTRRVSYKTSKIRRFFGFLAVFPSVVKKRPAIKQNSTPAPIIETVSHLRRKNDKRKKAFFLAYFSVKFSRRRSI